MQARLKWLRGAVREGLGELERGEGIEFQRAEDLEEQIDRLGQEAQAAVASKRNHG